MSQFLQMFCMCCFVYKVRLSFAKFCRLLRLLHQTEATPQRQLVCMKPHCMQLWPATYRRYCLCAKQGQKCSGHIPDAGWRFRWTSSFRRLKARKVVNYKLPWELEWMLLQAFSMTTQRRCTRWSWMISVASGRPAGDVLCTCNAVKCKGMVKLACQIQCCLPACFETCPRRIQ